METRLTKEKEIFIFTQALKEMNDSIEKQRYHNAYRCAGFLEAKLIDFGVFKIGVKFPYKQIMEKHRFLFWKFNTVKEDFEKAVKTCNKIFMECEYGDFQHDGGEFDKGCIVTTNTKRALDNKRKCIKAALISYIMSQKDHEKLIKNKFEISGNLTSALSYKMEVGKDGSKNYYKSTLLDLLTVNTSKASRRSEAMEIIKKCFTVKG